jgi:NAD(P)-dependent dehydrogenase (short-subunit alcohol dehydrogenase family)
MNRHAKAAILAANRWGATPTGLTGRYRRLRPGFAATALHDAVADKVVLVTGASSGIGEATARSVAAAGAHVLLVARRADELNRMRAEIEASGGRADAYPCDLTDFDALDATAAKIIAEHGQVDILVNNAALSIRRRVRDSMDRFHDFERPMRLNYFAAIRLTMAVLPGMLAQRSGQVISISTWSVQVRPMRFSGYVASKAALEAWTDCAQGEFGPDGIVFTTIRMPLVRTPMIAPTAAYRRLPALSADQAAATVADAMIYRPRRLRPAFSQALALPDALSPRSMDRIRRVVG